MATSRHYRCKYCGRVLPAWLPAAKRPNGAMLLHHLADMHPTEARPYLTRMATEDIATVAAEASEAVEENTDAGTTCKEISETCSGVINAVL
jgi:hypothetical protein